MGTLYVKCGTVAERSRLLLNLLQVDKDKETFRVLLEKLKAAAADGGRTVSLRFSYSPVTDYDKLVNKLMDVGITGLRYQKTVNAEKATWLAIRLATDVHRDVLAGGLVDQGLTVV